MSVSNVSGLIGQPSAINSQSASYTLASTDASKVILATSSSSNTITVPLYSVAGIPVGSKVSVIQYGAGQVTFAGASGVTINGTPGLKTRAQYSRAELIQVSTDAWVLYGDISA